MPDYPVRYEINAFDVGSPTEAAEQVARHLENGYSLRGVYEVVHEDGTITRVDLAEEDE